jgi:hypothetical protein
VIATFLKKWNERKIEDLILSCIWMLTEVSDEVISEQRLDFIGGWIKEHRLSEPQ